MGNHYHLILVLKGDPDELKSFMEYFDGETAKLINRFRGRTGTNAWANCFPEGQNKTREELRSLIIDEVEKGEKKIRKQRGDKRVFGAHELAKQCFHKRYTSKKYLKRPICISTRPLIKKQFIDEYREFVRQCKEAWVLFKETRGHVIWPPGAFPPSRVVFGSCLSI